MNDKFLDRNSFIDTTIGVLPHWHQDGKLQFVTFHLGDSMPQTVLADMQREKENWLNTHPQPWDAESEKEYHIRFSQFVDRWLDKGVGACVLRDPIVAEIMENALLYHHGKRCLIHSYVIMSNHVHVLVELLAGNKSQDLLHSWKSFTSNEINKLLGKTGQLWHHESFDRLISDEAHYQNVRRYIEKNVRQGGVRWKI